MGSCGTIGHVHGTGCDTTSDAPPVQASALPRTVPAAEAEILERCRAALMHRSGIHTHATDTPPMTTRETTVPTGVEAVDLGTVVVMLQDPTPVRRARLTSAVAAAIGLPSLKMERDAVQDHLSYTLGISTNIEIGMVVRAWETISTIEGAAYVRIEGLSRHGLWVVENRPEGEIDERPWRFVLSGPENVA